MVIEYLVDGSNWPLIEYNSAVLAFDVPDRLVAMY